MVAKQVDGSQDGDQQYKNPPYHDTDRMYRFLNLLIKPGRVRIVETAWMLGFSPHDIPILMTGGLLKPIGSPTQQCTKYFCIIQVEALRTDTEWKAKASDYLLRHWQGKNLKAKAKRPRRTNRGEAG